MAEFTEDKAVLSRRVAKITVSKTINSLYDSGNYAAFARAVGNADSFESLPDGVKDLILKGEEEVSRGDYYWVD